MRYILSLFLFISIAMTEPKYRGAQVAPFAPIADVRSLINTKAGLIRYQLAWAWDAIASMTREEYLSWVQSNVFAIKQYSALRGNFRIIVAMQMPPGEFNSENHQTMFTTPKHRETFFLAWDYIIENLKDQDKVIGYLWINEPRTTGGRLKSLYSQINIRYRNIKKHHIYTMVNGAPSNGGSILPKNGKGWLCAHMYQPFSFTHQGVYNAPIGRKYPDAKNNKATTAKKLESLKKVPKNYKVYLGEFAASIFADSKSRNAYYKDVIDIANANKWYWTFHAWREAEVWDIERDAKLLKLVKNKIKE